MISRRSNSLSALLLLLTGFIVLLWFAGNIYLIQRVINSDQINVEFDNGPVPINWNFLPIIKADLINQFVKNKEKKLLLLGNSSANQFTAEVIHEYLECGQWRFFNAFIPGLSPNFLSIELETLLPKMSSNDTVILLVDPVLFTQKTDATAMFSPWVSGINRILGFLTYGRPAVFPRLYDRRNVSITLDYYNNLFGLLHEGMEYRPSYLLQGDGSGSIIGEEEVEKNVIRGTHRPNKLGPPISREYDLRQARRISKLLKYAVPHIILVEFPSFQSSSYVVDGQVGIRRYQSFLEKYFGDLEIISPDWSGGYEYYLDHNHLLKSGMESFLIQLGPLLNEHICDTQKEFKT